MPTFTIALENVLIGRGETLLYSTDNHFLPLPATW